MASGNGNKNRLADSFLRSRNRESAINPDTTDREQRLMNAIATMSAISVRQSIASRLGKSFSDNRNLYDALGYKLNPTFNDYAAKYQRMDIARTIVDLPVRECWRNIPELTESQDKDTPFEKEWLNLVKSHRIFHYLSRADRLGSLGTYSVLYLGFDDSADPKDEVTKARNLLYMMPYSMANASISQYETDAKSPRYGKPVIYNLNLKSIGSATSTARGSTVNVHHSRIIHIAEDCLEDDVEGIPRLRAVLNRLEDIEKLSGGSAEMFWLGAFPGFGVKTDPGYTIGAQGLDDLEDEIDKYIHTPQRYMRLRGMSIENLGTQIADPKGHMDVQLDLISAATRIPKRILLGSERGELASSQDEKAWAKVIQARQSEHCEPVLLRPFVDKLITVGILPKPGKEEYNIEWPDLLAPGDKDKAEIGEIWAKALAHYSNAIGAEDILPVSFFLHKGLGLTDDEIQEIEDLQATMLREEAADDDIEDEEETEDESGGDGDAQG